MRLILADAVPGPDSPGLEAHDERDRFLEGEARAGGVLYVGLHGGEAGTVLTARDAQALVRELVRWASERWGRGAVLAELPEELLRAELARRQARLLRGGLGEAPRSVQVEAADRGCALRSAIKWVLGSALPQGPWTLEGVQRHADLEVFSAKEIAECVTELVKAGEVRPVPTGGLVLSSAKAASPG